MALALTVTCAAGQLAAQERVRPSARSAIEAVNERYVAAYNAGDVATFARVYAPDATLMPSNSAPIQGHEAIGKFWQGGWKMGIRNVKLTTTELDVHGNSAAEVGQYQFDVQAGNGAATHDHGKYIVLWKRSPQGQWQWYRDIFNTDVAAAPATTAGSSVAQAGKGDRLEDEAIIRALSEKHPGRELRTENAIFWSGAYAQPSIGKQTAATPRPSAKFDQRRNVQETYTPVRIEVAPSGDMAYELANFSMSYDLADTKEHIAFQGADLTVWKKENGSWKVAAQFSRPFDDKP
jgi:uncharacterized protein (TIGR02246 family)